MAVFPKGATTNIDAATAAARPYDAVVVGAGITGAIVAHVKGRLAGTASSVMNNTM